MLIALRICWRVAVKGAAATFGLCRAFALIERLGLLRAAFAWQSANFAVTLVGLGAMMIVHRLLRVSLHTLTYRPAPLTWVVEL